MRLLERILSFNPSEFLTRTVGLPNKDVGAYIKLLSYSWVNGPIPSDPRVLASIAGRGDMALITARFFEVNEDGKLFDPRLEASRIEAAKLLEANRKRTMKASEERWKSTSRSRDVSVTETEDNDRTMTVPDPDKTGPEKTGKPPDRVFTLPQNPSVTLVQEKIPADTQGLIHAERQARLQAAKRKYPDQPESIYEAA